MSVLKCCFHYKEHYPHRAASLALASNSCSYKIFEKGKRLSARSKSSSLAFHTINLSAVSGCSLHILTYFMKLCSELTFHLLIMLQGSLSMSLYRLFSVSLLTRFAFFPRLDWHETRLDIMERCFFPLLLSEILYIIGTILRRTNQAQSKIKGQLLSRVRMYKSSTFGHSKSIFSDL